jgi:glycosyltransferase involved in cell wall biosynthesis
MTQRYKVVIIQRLLVHYRKPFFELLKKRLAQSDIELIFIYGTPADSEAQKKDGVEIDWAHRIETLHLNIGTRALYWQPCLKLLQGADLVIVEQAGKLLLNYILLIRQLIGLNKLCFWGHGKNFQEDSASYVGECIKRFMSRRAHWWFAYNDLSAAIVRSLGYPADRITSVQNAIDTRCLIEARQRIPASQLEQVKQALGIRGNNVCLYTGGMYREKRLGFLIESCIKIRSQIPDFAMIFIGAGPESARVKSASEKYQWIHYVGPKFNEDKVPYFMLAKLFLMPGLVGLAVLDCFALETPLVTTNVPYHSPEIDYLVDGVNGVIVGNSADPVIYANRVSSLLNDQDSRERLVAGCRAAQERYTLDEMVERFATGVISALSI